MKKKEFIKSLDTLKDFLKNTDVENMEDLKKIQQKNLDKGNVAVNIYTLMQLSKIKKLEWVELIQEFGFKIVLDKRASSRDIIGKILKYLEDNPLELEEFKRNYVKKKKPSSSNRTSLSSALDVILGDKFGTED